MRYVAWIPLVLAADLAILLLWVIVSQEENCGSGSPRWQCGPFLHDTLLPFLPYALVLGVVAIPVLVVLGAASRSRKPAEAAQSSGSGYECTVCGQRSISEEDAMSHAELAHGALSYQDMQFTWRRV